MAVRMAEMPRVSVMAVLPAILAVSLLFLPFLPEEIAAETALRTAVLAYLTIAAIDLFTKKVPNVLVYPAIAYTLSATAIVDSTALLSALLGGLAALGVMFGLALLSRGSMGMGDVKAAGLGGCIVGLPGGVIALMFGFAIGAAVSLPLLLLRLRGRRDSLPLTPFLAAGMLVYGLLVRFLLTPNL